MAGLKLTLIATLGGSAVALVVGLALAMVRLVRVPVLWWFCVFFTDFIRGTPLLVQLYFAFFVLPSFGITLSALKIGVIVLGVYNAAYMAEVYRAAVESVPREQIEGAKALNIPVARRWRSIILPQAAPTAIPELGNYIISMFKESALLSTITVTELLQQGEAFGSVTYRYLEPLTLVGLIYLVVSYISSIGLRWLERTMTYRR